MSVFRHDLEDLGSVVHFDSVRLQGAHMPIHIQSISAALLEAKTANAPISGSFNVTDSLRLETSNAKIEAKIHASNGDWHKPTKLTLATSNSPIDVEASLVPLEAADGATSGYQLKTRTSNGFLNINIPTAPAGSHLDIHGSTSNVGASVVLPPAFEGTISARTSNAGVNLNHHHTAEDPLGERREHHVVTEENMWGKLRGKTWWGDDAKTLGTVEIQTSNAMVGVTVR